MECFDPCRSRASVVRPQPSLHWVFMIFCCIVLVALLNTDFLGALLLQLHPEKESQAAALCLLVQVPWLHLFTFQNRNVLIILWLNVWYLKLVFIVLLLKKLSSCLVETCQSYITVSSNSSKAVLRILWPHQKGVNCLTLQSRKRVTIEGLCIVFRHSRNGGKTRNNSSLSEAIVHEQRPFPGPCCLLSTKCNAYWTELSQVHGWH